MLKENESGRLVQASRRVASSDDVKNLAIQEFHKVGLDDAKKAIGAVDPEFREFQSMVINLKDLDLTKAKRFIREFCDEFATELEEKENGEGTYKLQIQFYPMTKKGSK